MKVNQYYYPLKDGYDIGDIVPIDNYSYEVIEIDQVDQTMLLEKII